MANELKEQIDNLLLRCCNRMLAIHITRDQILNLYKEWFKGELDKLTVIGDEEIAQVFVIKRADYVTSSDRKVARTQLNHTISQLKELLGGENDGTGIERENKRGLQRITRCWIS